MTVLLLSSLNSLYFIFFLSNAVVMTFNTMLSKTGESGDPCLVPDLRGNAFSFSLLNIMLAVGLSCMDLLC